jgi:hypothetical protein
MAIMAVAVAMMNNNPTILAVALLAFIGPLRCLIDVAVEPAVFALHLFTLRPVVAAHP